MTQRLQKAAAVALGVVTVVMCSVFVYVLVTEKPPVLSGPDGLQVQLMSDEVVDKYSSVHKFISIAFLVSVLFVGLGVAYKLYPARSNVRAASKKTAAVDAAERTGEIAALLSDEDSFEPTTQEAVWKLYEDSESDL